MALKALVLKAKIDKKNEELKALRAKDVEFATREAELENSIEEASTDEEQELVQAEIEKFEAEKEEHEKAKTTLENEVSELEKELEETESNTPDTRSNTKHKERVKEMDFNIRSLPKHKKAFEALTREKREEIVEREDVKAFISQVRGIMKEKRAISGADLTIPVVFLELISENMYRYSKLINRVRVRNVTGEARQTIAGTIPEAVWTEMCGAINELSFNFNQMTFDGYKVAGFVPVCNSLLEDSDIDLAAWIIEMISESLGYAKDKAILYGKGGASHMPLGIVTRLAQSAKPENYPANAPAWQNLSTTNIIKIDGASLTGAQFWAKLMEAVGNTYTRYNRGTMFWAMNSKTYSQLRSKLITFTGTGDIVANLFGVLPIITGDVDILEFIPDGDIIGGYGDLYLWVNRRDMTLDSDASGIFFIQDNTVFRGKERADGAPIIPGAFVAININNASVTTAMNFAADTANDAQLTDLKVGSETLSFDPETYSYTVTASQASDKIEATPSQSDAQIAISYNGKNVRNGGTVTWLADSDAHPLTVEVRKGNAVRVYTVNVTKAG